MIDAYSACTKHMQINMTLQHRVSMQEDTAGPKRAAVSDYMRRFCSNLGMNHKESQACVAVADNAVPREGTDRSVGSCNYFQQSGCNQRCCCHMLMFLMLVSLVCKHVLLFG